MLKRTFLGLVMLLGLAACAAEPVWAPEAQVQAAKYRHEGPPTLSLITVVNNKTGSGAHSGLMVSGSQRVIFDPAGTFKHASIPERNDVIFGVNRNVYSTYINYHTRKSFDTYVQTIKVSPEVAERALRAVQAYGAVPKAQCSRSLTSILAGLPGFEGFPQSWFPNATRKNFAKLPGVTEQHFVDDDSDDNKYLLLQPI